MQLNIAQAAAKRTGNPYPAGRAALQVSETKGSNGERILTFTVPVEVYEKAATVAQDAWLADCRARGIAPTSEDAPDRPGLGVFLEPTDPHFRGFFSGFSPNPKTRK